ncbi:MAG: hypothetical protein ACPL5I_07280 [Thermodesulfobacteriota bacterium]
MCACYFFYNSFNPIHLGAVTEKNLEYIAHANDYDQFILKQTIYGAISVPSKQKICPRILTPYN